MVFLLLQTLLSVKCWSTKVSVQFLWALDLFYSLDTVNILNHFTLLKIVLTGLQAFVVFIVNIHSKQNFACRTFCCSLCEKSLVYNLK